MLEHALTVPGTGHLLPVQVWMGSNPGAPWHHPSQGPQPDPEAVALSRSRALGHDWGFVFLRRPTVTIPTVIITHAD